MKLPEHKCGLFLTHNEHKDFYMTAEEWIKEQDNRECPSDWANEECKQRAIATNEIWNLHWYPDNPTSSYDIFAPTLDELLEFATTMK